MNQTQLKEEFNNAELGFKIQVSDQQVDHYRLIRKYKDVPSDVDLMFVVDSRVVETGESFFCEDYEVANYSHAIVNGRLCIAKWSGDHFANIWIPITANI